MPFRPPAIPPLRALAAAALAVVPLPAPSDSGGAWLDSAESALVESGGVPLRLDGRPAVFHAPLSAVWVFAEGGPDAPLLRSGDIHRGGSGAEGFMAIVWDDGGITTYNGSRLPSLVVTEGSPHPLAVFHDRLLSQALARPLAGLPAGSRFLRGGTVSVPGGDETLTVWRSLGDFLKITPPGGRERTLPWRAVDAALEGGS